MKRGYFAFFLIFLFLCFTESFAASNLEEGVSQLAEQISKNMQEKQKQKIAIIDFSDLNGNVTALGQFMAEELTTQLFIIAPGKFEVVERRQLLKLEEELALGQIGFIEEKGIKKMGQVLGVDAIVTGSMTDLGNTVKVNARLIAVESAKVFAVAATDIPKTGMVADLIAKGVERSGPAAKAPATPSATVQPAKQAKVKQTADSWKVDLNRDVGVFEESWNVTLQYVERKKDALIVGIGFRNITKKIMRGDLSSNYKETTILLDDEVGNEFNLKGVEGISTNTLNVNPGAKKIARFTFPFPEGVKKVRFVSVWGLENLKRGYCCDIYPLSIPFNIPPDAEGDE